jgi:predicted dehydrogenase
MTLRVGVVGAGYFSAFHLGSWTRIPQVQVVGVHDSDPTRLNPLALPVFETLGQLLDSRPDILDLILPPGAHDAVVRTALAAGIRTIICQKPFCSSLAQAEAVTKLASSVGARIIIHENFRFQPWFRAIKAALPDLGIVQQATFRLRPGDGQGPRAYLDRQPYFQTLPRLLIQETGIHYVDTFRYLLGDPTAVYADLRHLNPAVIGEDAGHALFDHPGNVRALFDGNRHLDHAADNRRRTMGEGLFEGTEGTITLLGDGSVHLRRFGQNAAHQILPPDTWQGFGGDCAHALQSHVVSGLLHGTPLENEAPDYLTVVRIQEALYRSAREGRKITLEPA